MSSGGKKGMSGYYYNYLFCYLLVICVHFSGETSDILDERKPFSGVGRELIIIHTVETVNLWTRLMKIVLLLQVYSNRFIHFLFYFLFCHHSKALSVTSVITITVSMHLYYED